MCDKYRCENYFGHAISLLTQKGERFRMKLWLLLLCLWPRFQFPVAPTWQIQDTPKRDFQIWEHFDIIHEMNVSEKKRIFVWRCGFCIQKSAFCNCSMDTRGCCAWVWTPQLEIWALKQIKINVDQVESWPDKYTWVVYPKEQISHWSSHVVHGRATHRGQ